MSNRVVQGLWIGPELSAMERLSAASFLAHGHEYHLYVYDDVKHIPAGASVRDANEILPASSIFQYKGTKSYAGFANHFRYELLLSRGGWWADTDVICLKPFEFTSPYVFASEPHAGGRIANNGVMKAPAASELLAHLCRVCRAKDPEKLVWGETGPRLLDASIKEFALDEYLTVPRVFCPLGYTEWAAALDPAARLTFGEETYAVHLWNEMWRRDGRDKNGRYHPDCLYERLKRRYL
jgi:mannosyltransferase OCH1-like enzyme